jgi:glycosyltransferase involved in cell wall biosynthesis
MDGVTCCFVKEERPVVKVPGRRVQRARLPRLFDRVAAFNPDLLHFEGLLFPRQLRALMQRVPGVPVVAQDHGSRVPRGWRRLMHRWGFAPLSGVIFTARDQADPFRAAGVLRADIPVYEVIEGSSTFTPGDVAAARAATALAGEPCLLWVGNLDRNKDPLTVLDAVARAATRLPGLRLWMCYRDATLLDAVRARVDRDPALRDRVHLLGRVPYPDIEQHMRAADFLVQGSSKEGSGFGVIEALACGVVPLVSDIPSFRVITGGGTVGGLFPPGDAEALSRLIVDWSARDRAALRRGAREHFERALSFPAIGRQLAEAYRRIWASG